MPKYFFKAKNLQGKIVHGTLDANSKQEAQLHLQSRQLIPIKVLAASQVQNFISTQKQSSFLNFLSQPSVSLRQLQIFSRQFSTLIQAGLPIVDSLQILTGQFPKSNALRDILVQIKIKIESGQSLSQAMLSFPKAFDSFYVSMVKAGESGGVLDKILQRISNALEKKRKIRKDIISASFYPAIVIIFSTVVMMGVLLFVVPQFAELYQNSKQQLPGITLMTLKASSIIRSYWHGILLSLFGLPLILFYSYQNLSMRRFWDTLFAHTPFIQSLVQKSSITYFTQTLSSLLHAGVHMLEAIRIASQTSTNIFYKDIFERSLKAVEQGATFSSYLQSQSTYIPSMLTQMIVVGEQSGNMDLMLEKVALFYEEELESTLKRIISLIEPLLIVIFGIMIAFVIISIYLPIFKASSALGL